MSLKIKPLEDRVVVEALAADEKTASGIILPDTCLLYTSPSPRD